jgi:DtxR family Mn-dependent transcriptional regulator
VERVEEYLEAIYDLQQREKKVVRTNDLAKKLNVRPSSVTEMLSKLSEKGFVEYQPYYGVALTEKGSEVAKRVKRFHKIFEVFFTDFLGVDRDEAHKLSCELEHHVNDEVADRVCMLIASSDCRACSDCDRTFFALSNAPDGQYEIMAAPVISQRIGFEPGRIILKSGNEITLILKDKKEEYTISHELASKIIVKSMEV